MGHIQLIRVVVDWGHEKEFAYISVCSVGRGVGGGGLSKFVDCWFG